MAKCMLRNGRIIGDFERPYYVAEVNTSHFGKIENAKLMIDAAVDAGCDCVKFQSWSAESLYSKTYYDENPFAKRMVSRFVFSEEQLHELAMYCQERGISFASTPYSEEEVDFLIEVCNAPYIKVASMDLDNEKFLTYIAKKNVPIVLSTGMSTMEEIEEAVSLLKKENVKNLCLLHCISVYPPELKDIHLNNILGLREKYPDIPIGFSDHSLGQEMAIAATALGIVLLEKHLTLDKSKIGMDNQMAMEPNDMKQMVQNCNNVFDAMGVKERSLSQSELEQKTKMRRSIIAVTDIKAGTVIEEAMLGAKRPATGIPLSKMKNILGCKVKRDIQADHVINYKDIEEKNI